MTAKLCGFDMRTHQLDERLLREGNKIHIQYRTNIINLDGSIECGEYSTVSTIPNYGDCFDEKPSFLKRFIKPIEGE